MIEEQVAERDDVEVGALVMPFYLICDVSQSMTPSMSALNQALVGLNTAIRTEPLVDDVARICVMTFSDVAEVVLPLTQMSETGMPTLRVQGGTNYGAAFRLLAATVAQDNAGLKQQGYKVFRPCAFFLTDGEPMDSDWEQTFQSTLTYDRSTGHGMKGHPIFVPFGFDAAKASVLARLAYPPERGKWYLSRDTSPVDALRGLLDLILHTVVTGGMTAAQTPAFVPAPPPPDGSIVQGDYDPDYV